ncbi:MAG TPA: hypothetical protein VHE12_13700 [bacterium]|nr:hypothetical protein [bacterium]
MQPDFFEADYGQLTEAIFVVVLLSFVIERVLAVVFEHALYKKYLDGRGLSAPLAVALSFVVCWKFHFDLLAILFKAQAAGGGGTLLTAMLISGGSKGTMALMQYFIQALNLRSAALQIQARKIAPKGGK